MISATSTLPNPEDPATAVSRERQDFVVDGSGHSPNLEITTAADVRGRRELGVKDADPHQNRKTPQEGGVRLVLAAQSLTELGAQ